MSRSRQGRGTRGKHHSVSAGFNGLEKEKKARVCDETGSSLESWSL